MRNIDVKEIEESLYKAVGQIASQYDPDIIHALKEGYEVENDRAKAALNMLIKNADIAEKEKTPVCQDTGMAIVWIHAGQDVHFMNGNLYDAIQRGIARGYKDNYLRASVVKDPLYARNNTGNNTPALIHMDMIPGEKVIVEIMEKGFGSENKSALKMLTPADGEQGTVSFILETVRNAGPNACPPFIIGVGIGSDFEGCAELSKHALMRPLYSKNSDPQYAALEKKLLQKINAMNIGPLGLHGKTTALAVHIEEAPTHIAGLPVAVNMCCHVCRHWKGEL